MKHLALVFKIPKLPLNIYEIRQNLQPEKFSEDSLVKFTYMNLYMNMACKHYFADFQWIFRDFSNIYREDIDDLSVKSFTGRYSSLISYIKTVLEFWIPGQKSYHLRFSCFRLFHGQLIVWILKLPIKTAKLPNKVPIAVQTSWLNCLKGEFTFLFIRELHIFQAQ